MGGRTFDVTAVVLGVTGKPVKSGIMYEVTFSDGTSAATKNAPLATKAKSLETQQVTARITEKQNGRYTNRYLDEIAGPGETLEPNADAQAAAAGIPIVGSNGNAAPGIPIVGQGDEFQRRMHPDVEARVTRLAAIGAAAQLFAGAGPEALPEMLEVAQRIYTVAYGEQNVVQQVAQTPEAVAAAVNATVGSEAVAVGKAPAW